MQHQQHYTSRTTAPSAWSERRAVASDTKQDDSAAASSSSSSNTQESSSDDDDSSKRTLSLFSPCKINLFLRIIRKRDDGFHDLASLFQAIGFGDSLELTRLDQKSEGQKDSVDTGDEFTCNMPGVPTDSSNLVLRALELMRTRTGQQDAYFRANLVKQVPAQAGLGGGSANAATAMWGANQLMGNPASLEEVCSTSRRQGMRQRRDLPRTPYYIF